MKQNSVLFFKWSIDSLSWWNFSILSPNTTTKLNNYIFQTSKILNFKFCLQTLIASIQSQWRYKVKTHTFNCAVYF